VLRFDYLPLTHGNLPGPVPVPTGSGSFQATFLVQCPQMGFNVAFGPI
jgi:hypothetical protein